MNLPIEDRPRVTIRTDLPSIRNLLSRNKNKFFGVKFIKRTTGLSRVMNCHTIDSRKGRFKVNLKEKALFPVIDTKKGELRTIPLDTLLEIRMEGKVYLLNQSSLTLSNPLR